MESSQQQTIATATAASNVASKPVSAPNAATTAATTATIETKTSNGPTTPSTATAMPSCVTLSTNKSSVITCNPDVTEVASISTLPPAYDAAAITIPPMPSLNSPSINISFAHTQQQQQLYQPIAAAAVAAPLQVTSIQPWDVEGWIPKTPSGQQKSPNMIRNELQRYIDECRRTKASTQTAVIQTMGVNNNSFRKFMNPKTYKDPWSAVQNSTYWAGARLLEQLKHQKGRSANGGVKKRKTAGGTVVGTKSATKKAKESTSTKSTAATTSSTPKKKTKAEAKLEIQNLIQRVMAVPNVSYTNGVYDSCPQIVTKIKLFLQRDGATKSILLTALGNINSNSMNRFLAGKKQDQRGNVTYKEAYVFFEKLRILEGLPKSAARVKSEAEHPNGFSIVGKPKGARFEKFLPLMPWET